MRTSSLDHPLTSADLCSSPFLKAVLLPITYLGLWQQLWLIALRKIDDGKLEAAFSPSAFILSETYVAFYNMRG